MKHRRAKKHYTMQPTADHERESAKPIAPIKIKYSLRAPTNKRPCYADRKSVLVKLIAPI